MPRGGLVITNPKPSSSVGSTPATCCSKFVKDDPEQTTLFDEWLIECERMSEAMASLKNFDESTGDED